VNDDNTPRASDDFASLGRALGNPRIMISLAVGASALRGVAVLVAHCAIMIAEYNFSRARSIFHAALLFARII
jgi:hypothetical protein